MNDFLVYFVPIYCLEVDPPDDDVEVFPGLTLTTRFSRIERHLDPSFFEMIGKLDVSDLQKTNAILYTMGDPKRLAEMKLTEDGFILRMGSYASLLLHCLWLIRDHSVFPGTGFVQKRLGENILVYSNYLANNWTDASGQRSTTIFGPDELRQAGDFMRNSLHLAKHDFRLDPDSGFALLGSQRGAKRLARALYFSSVARGQLDLGVKIVNYCTVLESLFSTDSAELSHKVAHRTAVFIGGTTENKIGTFTLVKKAYGTRSKVVHGASLGKDAAQQIRVISRELDDLVRKTLNKIFRSETIRIQFEASDEDMERYFLRESLS